MAAQPSPISPVHFPEMRKLESSRRPIERAMHTPGAIYASEDVFAMEKERVFMKDWLLVGRVEEVENPGDYFTHVVMGEPIVVARHETGNIHVFYNQCRHRGVEVAQGSGNTKRFMCPYHAWTYNLDGSLFGAPFMKETVGFDPHKCSLKPLKVGVWAGWIFASFNLEVEPLEKHVAFLEEEFGMLRMQDCRLAHKFVLELNCNWKFVYENLLDNYHVGTLHAKTIGRLQKSADRKFNLKPNGRLSVHYEAKTITPDGVSRIGKMPWLENESDYFARTGFLPPNVTFLVRCDYVRPFVHWPIAPDRTRSIAYFMFPKEKFDTPGFQENVEVYINYMKNVLDEDRTMVESLQRAMKTRGYEPGPMSTKETSIHHLINYHLDRLFPTSG
jgi:choline monooxygenase